MRRKEKSVLKTGLITSGICTAIDLFLQWREKKETGDRLTWETLDKKRSLKVGVLSFTAGAGLGYLNYLHKVGKEKLENYSPDTYLKSILKEENLKTDAAYFNKVLHYRKKIREWITRKFGSHMVTRVPEEGGSFIKRTAIASNYDSDFVIPFAKDSYATLKSMHDDVYQKAVSFFGNKGCVTKSTKGICKLPQTSAS